jgi:hypothetical protein
MPLFKSTYNILKKQDEDEVFNPAWMDSNELILPPKVDWTYDRDMQVEDVDIWEVLHEQGGGYGVYAAWLPYAEFYMLCKGTDLRNESYCVNGFFYQGREIETFYGQNAQERVYRRAKEIGIELPVFKTWVDQDKMWLYTK